MKLKERVKHTFMFDEVKMEKNDEICVGGRTVYYALMRVFSNGEMAYAIAAGDGLEAELRFIPNSLDAGTVYDIILSGEVAPCTLGDVLEDMEKETTY